VASTSGKIPLGLISAGGALTVLAPDPARLIRPAASPSPMESVVAAVPAAKFCPVLVGVGSGVRFL
jgi:hypothetical protein